MLVPFWIETKLIVAQFAALLERWFLFLIIAVHTSIVKTVLERKKDLKQYKRKIYVATNRRRIRFRFQNSVILW